MHKWDNFYRTVPMITSNSKSNDPDTGTHPQESLLSAFGQYVVPLKAGDNVSLQLYFKRAEQPDTGKIFVDSNNITLPSDSSFLSAGPTMSIIKIS